MKTFRFASAGVLALLVAAVVPAHAGLVIHPTYDTTVTGDLNSAAIISIINQAIHTYQDLFSNNFTIQIYFQEGSTSYERPGGINDGPECMPTPTGLGIMNGNVPNICAVGAGGVFDGIISLDVRDTPISQLLALAEHELELFFGTGSGNGQGNGTPGTLFPNGTPSTNSGTSFSGNGGGTPNGFGGGTPGGNGGGTPGGNSGGIPGGNPAGGPTGTTPLTSGTTVPEPATYVMLLGSLAVLGLKRRRSPQSPA